MKNKIRFIISSLLICFTVGCVSDMDLGKALDTGLMVADAAKGLSDEEETAIGKDMSAMLLANYGLYDNESVNRYVSLVGQALARKSERTNIEYHFAVLNTESVNAFAAPGGYIFITKGALSIIEDESELAGVLAHEVAHVSCKHIAKEIKKSNLIGAGLNVAESLSEDPELLNKLSGLGTDMLFKGYSRKDEKEADLKGLHILTGAGYTRVGFKNFLVKLQERSKGSNKFAVLMKTHPNPDKRLEELKGELADTKGKINKARFKQSAKI